MSWLARSIANTLRFDEEDDGGADASNRHQHESQSNTDENQSPSSSTPLPESPGRGVTEDLSELRKTLTRQLWGVASFLAPPPHSYPSRSHDSNPSDSDLGANDSDRIDGIRSDFTEISGKFRTEISKLSSNIAVSEFTKMASNLLQLGSEGRNVVDLESGEAVGVTEDVLVFVRNIAVHSETWLDFPLPEDEDDEEFDLSDTQQEHALAVESLVPQLAALRIELCPGYMSEAYFWKIYFVLLYPRLDKYAAKLLITPEIAKIRASLTVELQKHSQATIEEDKASKMPSFSNDMNNIPHEEPVTVTSQPDSLPLETSALVTEKHTISSTEIPIIDKSVIQEGPVEKKNIMPSGSFPVLEEKEEDDGDDWLKEEDSEIMGAGGTSIPIENDEDVSFSDLEDEDGDVPTSYKRVTYSSESSTKDSREWVQLNKSSMNPAKDIHSVTTQPGSSRQVSAHNSEAKDSNDWLNVDDIDMA